MIRITHLLDDVDIGVVTRALSLFDDPRMMREAESRTIRMGRGPAGAVRLDSELIVIHVPPSWGRLPYLAALRLKNPHARIVQVEYSHTRAFEAEAVSSPGRFRTLLQTAARPVDEVIAMSVAQRRWLAEAGVPSRKLQTIHPWSGRDDLYRVPDLEPRGGPLRLLAYGRLAPEKNFAALIEAMGSFRADEVTLTLAGSGPEVKRLVELASERDNVRLLPATNAIDARLAACSAVIVPSRYEAFGLVATEARMAGRPVLVADIDGLPEQVRSGGGVAAPMRNAAEIACAIIRLKGADLPTMGRAARAGVIQQHDEIITGWQAVLRRAEPLRKKAGVQPAMAAGA